MSKRKKYIRLSYPLAESTPLYPGTPPVEITKVKDMERGDSCDVFLLTLSNHGGTHVDAPRHFFSDGRPIETYDIDELRFTSPAVIDCLKPPGAIIEPEDLINKDSSACDMLLVRTGFGEIREKDPQAYCTDNPFISPQAAAYIRSNYPRIRAMGIDAISISSSRHSSLGREAHRTLLGREGFKGQPILIIEDMNIPASLSTLQEVIVVPMLVEGIDSAPCTVIGVTE